MMLARYRATAMVDVGQKRSPSLSALFGRSCRFVSTVYEVVLA